MRRCSLQPRAALTRDRGRKPIEFELELDIRGSGVTDEVDDQPDKAPVGHPAPEGAELSEDAIDALGVRRLCGWVRP
jgi:hypothetical protein